MIQSIPLGTYVPGESVVHKTPPLVKLGILIVFIVVSTVWGTTPLRALSSCVVAVSLYFVAKIPLPVAWSQLWLPLPVLLTLGAFQWWQRGAFYSSSLILTIYAGLMAAVLVTLTSTLVSMMDALECALQPLKKYGFPIESVVLAFSLTLRLLPLMLNTVNEVLDARKARGVAFSLTALGTPVMIRSIKRARSIADALMARGAGD